MSNNESKNRAEALINWLRQYAPQHIDSQMADEQRLYPPHVLADLGNQGFFGMHISEKFGGLALSTTDMLKVIEQVAAIDLTLAVILIESVQGAHTVEKYATASMKDRYLSLMATGRIFTSGAMTESAAGSNPRAMKSFAVPNNDNGWLINGSKRWVGMAACAELIALYVQQYDANDVWQGMSGFLVPRNTEGLQIGQDTPTMGIRGFPKNTITMQDIKVGSENLLGKSGEGMEIAQDNMMYIRLCLAAATTGAIKRCIQLMYRYATRRMIATGILVENPVTLTLLGKLTALADIVDHFVYSIARIYDRSPESVPEEAFVVSKIAGSEYLGEVVDNALQLLGARGYEDASEISRISRDARCFRIFEGPTEALNMYLGARVLEQNNRLEKFICKELGQSKLYNAMRNDIERVRARCQSSESALFLNEFSRSYRAQSLAGEILASGMLLACLEGFEKTGEHDISVHSIALARNQYEETVRRALLAADGSLANLNPEAIGRHVNGYSLSIGDIDQTRRGSRYAIDSLLLGAPSIESGGLLSRKHHEFFTARQSSDIQVKEPFSLTARKDRLTSHASILVGKTRKDYKTLNVCQLFELQANHTPNAIALVFGDQKVRYSELNEKAECVANYLRQALSGRSGTIALYFERSINQIVGLLGILKAGCAYLPMDFNYPEKQLAFMLEDSGASLILSTRILKDDFPFDSIKTVFIEDMPETYFSSLKSCMTAETSLDNPGYILYTSGSTGQPKGVVMPHGALTNLVQWHLEAIGGKRDTLQFTTINFDMSFIEIFGALCSGGTLVLISEQDRLNLDRFFEVVMKNNIEQLVISVPYLKALADSRPDTRYLKSLREIIIAGEQLVITPTLISLFDRLPDVRLHNYYGPTETHVVTAYTFPRDTTDWPDYPPIGTPVPNTEIYVLDENEKPVSLGETGEIYIGGVCLAKGYRNRHELTAEKFMQHSESGDLIQRFYRTGDIGKYLPDGNLVFLGRKDEQVKIRGYRIEPQEIEWHLLKYPGIKEAVVIAKKSNHSDRHLEAFLVPDGVARENLINDIYVFLQEQLPPHMLPSVFNIVESIPLTSSGKVNRIALEKIDSALAYEVNNIDEPATETEKAIIGIMESIFNVRVGANNSFYSIGGNSLLAMHILSKLRERFAVEIPAFSILSDPSIAHTAERIDKLLKAKVRSDC